MSGETATAKVDEQTTTYVRQDDGWKIETQPAGDLSIETPSEGAGSAGH